jgi:hypothetical protein
MVTAVESYTPRYTGVHPAGDIDNKFHTKALDCRSWCGGAGEV